MPAKFDRCVADVKAKGKIKNPFAICRASLGSDKQIRAHAKAKRLGKKAK